MSRIFNEGHCWATIIRVESDTELHPERLISWIIWRRGRSLTRCESLMRTESVKIRVRMNLELERNWNKISIGNVLILMEMLDVSLLNKERETREVQEKARKERIESEIWLW